jgi:hypothetical protein
MNWCLFVYRKLCEVDVKSHEDGNHGMKRFEFLSGSEDKMRSYYAEFCRGKRQILAVELINDMGSVVERQDGLIDLIDWLKTDKGEWDAGNWPVVEAVMECTLLEKPSSPFACLNARRTEREGGQPSSPTPST